MAGGGAVVAAQEPVLLAGLDEPQLDVKDTEDISITSKNQLNLVSDNTACKFKYEQSKKKKNNTIKITTGFPHSN